MNLQGKVAFITGGASGIGLGIAQACLSAGMNVALTYQTPRHLDGAFGILNPAPGRVHAIKLDVTDREAVAAAAEETEQRFGKVHVLVANAGVAPAVPLSNATFADWDWCMNINVGGVFNCLHAFLPRIKRHGEGGHVVATSSMAGGLVAGPFWGVYSASKFAVVGLMEALRSELADSNIGVSVFCPGSVRSNIGRSNRNRPADLAHTGAFDAGTASLVDEFRKQMGEILARAGHAPLEIEPLEAGEIVLDGIRNNDLYILSHPEFEQAIRDRSEALLASIPRNGTAPSDARVALAQLVQSPIYAKEITRKAQ